MMRTLPLRRLRGVVALGCFVAVVIPVAALAADDPPPVVTPSDPPPTMRVLSPEEALRTDAQRIAAERGWDEAATSALLTRQEVTGAFVADLAVKYPDTYGGAWTGDGPNGQLFVRFVGQVPSEVQDQAKQQGIAAIFLGGAKQSLAALEARSQRVHADLRAHGYPQVVTAFSVQEETILATATRARFDTRPVNELRAGLSAESRAPDVILTFAGGPIVDPHDTYAGDRTLASGLWKCTTGFTVYVGATKGVSSAGHCTGVNTYEQENGVRFGMTFQAEHRGTWGDFEWYTTPTSAVFPRYLYRDWRWTRRTSCQASVSHSILDTCDHLVMADKRAK
jgi:hypothetical protein